MMRSNIIDGKMQKINVIVIETVKKIACVITILSI